MKIEERNQNSIYLEPIYHTTNIVNNSTIKDVETKPPNI